MPVTHKELISVCEVQDLSKVKNIRNSKYMAFPYIMYKVNDLLQLTPEVLETYNDFLYKDEHVEYLVFKYFIDIHYINPGIFGECEVLTKSQMQSALSDDNKASLDRLHIKNMIFVKSL